MSHGQFSYPPSAGSALPPVNQAPPVQMSGAVHQPPQVVTSSNKSRSVWIVAITGMVLGITFFVFLVGIVIVFSMQPGSPSQDYYYGQTTYPQQMDDPWNNPYGAPGGYSEFQGEAEYGGMPYTSGSYDNSGGGNHVFSQDGEVFNLPPY